MRTTLDIAEDALEAIKARAAARSISMGVAATELVRQATRTPVPTKWENGLLVFDPGPEGAVTYEHVKKLIEQTEEEQ
jgi:pseudouridine-5'-phosphate glycosidase